MTEITLLALGSVAPIAAIVAWTWRRDRLPEPPRVVLLTFVLGGIATIPILVAEWGMMAMLGLNGMPESLVQAVLMSFLVAALVEEAFKLVVLTRYSATHSAFDEPYDGIVYGVAASLGFACVENVMYVFGANQAGFAAGATVAAARTLTAVPLHTCCGALMGVCIGISRSKSGSARRGWVAVGFLVAIALHGIYDTFAFAGPVAAREDDSMLAIAALGGVILTTLVGIGLSIGGAAWLRAAQRAERFAPTTQPA